MLRSAAPICSQQRASRWRLTGSCEYRTDWKVAIIWDHPALDASRASSRAAILRSENLMGRQPLGGLRRDCQRGFSQFVCRGILPDESRSSSCFRLQNCGAVSRRSAGPERARTTAKLLRIDNRFHLQREPATADAERAAEPTAALDVTVQIQIVVLLRQLQQDWA